MTVSKNKGGGVRLTAVGTESVGRSGARRGGETARETQSRRQTAASEAQTVQ